MKIAIAVLAMAAMSAQAEAVATIRNAEGGDIIFTNLKDDQCPKGNTVISYGMSGRTLFGCWAPGSIDYEIKDGIADLVMKAKVVWSNGQKNVYPIKYKASIIPQKVSKGVVL